MNMSSSISSKGSPRKLFATVLKGIKRGTKASAEKQGAPGTAPQELALLPPARLAG